MPCLDDDDAHLGGPLLRVLLPCVEILLRARETTPLPEPPTNIVAAGQTMLTTKRKRSAKGYIDTLAHHSEQVIGTKTTSK